MKKGILVLLLVNFSLSVCLGQGAFKTSKYYYYSLKRQPCFFALISNSNIVKIDPKVDSLLLKDFFSSRNQNNLKKQFVTNLKEIEAFRASKDSLLVYGNFELIIPSGRKMIGYSNMVFSTPVPENRLYYYNKSYFPYYTGIRSLSHNSINVSFLIRDK